MSKTTRVLFVVAVLCAPCAFATSFIVPTDDQMIAKSPAIVAGTIEGSYVRMVGTTIVTTYELRVSKSYKGMFCEGKIATISSMGGVLDGIGMFVPSSAHFNQGDEVLLFLSLAGYGWTPTDLTLGKFRYVTSTRGDRLLVRDDENVVEWDHTGNAHNEPVRREEGFLHFIEQRVHGRTAANDYVVDSSQVTIPAPKSSDRFRMATNPYTAGSYTSNLTCTLSNGGCNPDVTHPTRWPNMAGGVTFTRFNSITGAGDGGASVIQNGLAAWNNDCASASNLVYGGLQAGTPPGGNPGTDFFNVIAFNDPNNDIANSWNGAGTIAVTKLVYQIATHNFGGTDFFNIQSADVIYQDLYTASEPSFLTSMTHEVGHAIGWRHSNARPLSGNDQSVTCNGTTEDCTTTNTAIMWWQAGSFGNTLQPWDQNAVRAIYPGGSCSAVEGDTNADTTADIFWHRDTGENYLWLMAPSTGDVLNALGMPSVTPTTWNIVANGDFDGDGKGDLIWRRSSDGLNYLWTLNGGTLLNAVLLPSATTNWSVVGAGDFNNDGKDDLFWRDSTGLNYVWLMNGATVLNAIGLPSVPNPWIVVGVGDANGDGTEDVFWREPAAGSTYLWTMGAGVLTNAIGLPAVDTTWSPVAVADFSGDGKADIFWRRNDGSNYIWLMNGATVTLAAGMAAVDLSWSVVAAGDLNGDGKADLFWRNTSGLNYEWLLNGATLLNARGLPSVPDVTWRVKAPH